MTATETEQTTIEGTRICTVGRDGAKTAGYAYIFTGKIYEATRRKSGKLVWILVDTFGGTRSAKGQASAKFVAELKAAAKYQWVDKCTQFERCK